MSVVSVFMQLGLSNSSESFTDEGGPSPVWLSSERVEFMTWWLCVQSPVEATFPSGVFSLL